MTENKSLTEEMTNNIVRSAVINGIQEIVTACPLCKFNLENSQEAKTNNISVVYFTELLAETLNVK